MIWQDDSAYKAMTTRDARFDGRLFIGVTSTRIYCRPVCRVRPPLRKHCRFFDSAALAETAGFRPCLRCRPELAPGLSLIDSPHALANQAARLLERAAHDGAALSMASLAALLGVTDRHLRRIFMDVHGVTPLHFLTTQKLLFAKHLLTDTPLPITQVALSSGFGSVRRFNAAFQERYRLAPGALRKQSASDDAATPSSEALSLRLAYRPPYDTAGVLKFFQTRAMAGIESVNAKAATITRSLKLGTHRGWIKTTFSDTRHEVVVHVSPSLLRVLGRVIDQARHALDLDAQPDAIASALATVPAPAISGLRLPGSFDAFETTVRIILGQQITVAAAKTLAQRLVDRFGEALETPHAAITHTFPTAAVLAAASDDAIGSLGVVSSRIRAIKAIALAVADGRITLDRHQPTQATLDDLQAIPGVGPWTTQLVALRVLAWPDAFAPSDVGVLKALKMSKPAEAAACAEAWRPYRSYAVMQLWQSLETGT